MYVIGLTGGIASGKSTAAQTLRSLGAEVIDADEISRALTAPGGAAAPAIESRFGTLNRRALGAIVFRDEQARRELNAIVHPMVRAEMERRIAASQEPVVVLEAPLLFETGMETLCDEVWVVYVTREEQVRRVMARDKLTQYEAEARIDSQMSTEQKLQRADIAIDTSGTMALTSMRIEDLWQQALAKLGETPKQCLYPASVRRHRSATRQERQMRLEAQADARPRLSHTRPFVTRAVQEGAWEDTSTLLTVPEQRTFFARQPPVFWIVAGVLLVALLVVVGIVGVGAVRASEAARQEARRQEELAREKATYKLLYREEIDRNAREQGVDPALVAAVIYNESRFDPQAESYLGARGLMQIMEDTGEWIAGRLDEKEGYAFDLLYTPEANIRFGAWYLGFLSRLFDGDMVKITAGYHAGQNAVASWLENPQYSSDGKTLEVIPYPDTEQYVKRVVHTYEIYKRHYYTPLEVGDAQVQTS